MLSPHGPSVVGNGVVVSRKHPDDGMTSLNQVSRTLRFWKTLTECDLILHPPIKITFGGVT